jgi:hypothetical protein
MSSCRTRMDEGLRLFLLLKNTCTWLGIPRGGYRRLLRQSVTTRDHESSEERELEFVLEHRMNRPEATMGVPRTLMDPATIVGDCCVRPQWCHCQVLGIARLLPDGFFRYGLVLEPDI